MPEPKPDTIMGGPQPNLPGALPSVCCECGAICWIAPTGQALLEQHQLRVVCLTCGLRAILTQPDAKMLPLTEEQVSEIEAWRQQHRPAWQRKRSPHTGDPSMRETMSDQEPLDNIGYVCPLHAPRPDAHYTSLPPASFVGRYVKRAFAVRASTRIEHMWVKVDGVSPEGHLQGHLDNDPVYDTGYVCGDEVTVTLAEIEAVLD